MQNSQRVLLAKPRTAVASRWGGAGVRGAKPRTAPMARRRDGDIAPYRQGARGVRTATGREGWDAKPRTAPMARRREPGGPAAKHRALPQRDRTTGHEGATRVRGPSRTGEARVRAARGRSDERRFLQNREGGSHRRMRTRTREAPRFFAPIKLKNRESRRVDM